MALVYYSSLLSIYFLKTNAWEEERSVQHIDIIYTLVVLAYYLSRMTTVRFELAIR